jgi:peptide/nickel transport system substrate-binding protein
MSRFDKAAISSSGIVATLLAAVLLTAHPACEQKRPASDAPSGPTTLTIGFGLTSAGQGLTTGILEAMRSLALERLILFGANGRGQGRLAERWTVSEDGRRVQISLRQNVQFHDGTPLTAAVVVPVLTKELPGVMGPAFEDVEGIQAVGSHEIEVTLKRRSMFLIEGLEATIRQSGNVTVGTGPFQVDRQAGSEELMRANESYYLGKPYIDSVRFKSYESTRAAWADMLRGHVDMLYEVGIDALDFVRPSTNTNIFMFDRPYTYMVVLNLRRPLLADAHFRRDLNAAVDRDAIVQTALNGQGQPSGGPVSPLHWAYEQSFPNFRYAPRQATTSIKPRFTCLVFDPSHERLVLTIQQQLQAIGVDMQLEFVTEGAGDRLQRGDFDAYFADAVSGPTMLRPYLFWHSRGNNNWGRYASAAVDAAFDQIRASATDDQYKAGVAAFQQAIVDDPPAIFIAWSRRARAVLKRFDVPAEPGRDILGSLRSWRPASDKGIDSPN